MSLSVPAINQQHGISCCTDDKGSVVYKHWRFTTAWTFLWFTNCNARITSFFHLPVISIYIIKYNAAIHFEMKSFVFFFNVLAVTSVCT